MLDCITTALQMEANSAEGRSSATKATSHHQKVQVPPHRVETVTENDQSQLLVLIELPGVTSTENLVVHIEQKALDLRASHATASYQLSLPLPRAVDIDRGSFKFKKAKAQLRLLLPIVTGTERDGGDGSGGASCRPAAELTRPATSQRWEAASSSGGSSPCSSPPAERASPPPLLHEMQTFTFPWTTLQVAVAPPVVGTPNNVGACVWVCSIALAAHIGEDPDTLALLKDRDVLELGCGCGLVGLVAAGCGARSVVLSDSETHVLANLHHSVEASPHRRHIEVRRIAWEDECEEISRREEAAGGADEGAAPQDPGPGDEMYEVILGSDLLYTMDRGALLLGAIRRRLAPGGTCLVTNCTRDMRMIHSFVASMQHVPDLSLERRMIQLSKEVVEAQDDVGLLAEWQLYKGAFELFIIKRSE